MLTGQLQLLPWGPGFAHSRQGMGYTAALAAAAAAVPLGRPAGWLSCGCAGCHVGRLFDVWLCCLSARSEAVLWLHVHRPREPGRQGRGGTQLSGQGACSRKLRQPSCDPNCRPRGQTCGWEYHCDSQTATQQPATLTHKCVSPLQPNYLISHIQPPCPPTNAARPPPPPPTHLPIKLLLNTFSMGTSFRLHQATVMRGSM